MSKEMSIDSSHQTTNEFPGAQSARIQRSRVSESGRVELRPLAAMAGEGLSSSSHVALGFPQRFGQSSVLGAISSKCRLDALQNLDRFAGAIFCGDLLADRRGYRGVLLARNQVEDSFRENIGSCVA